MKKDRRKRDIRSKLVAAICMLLVSCIMVVSSTYAWFTLSTAPEVSGISTAIGANGNLEMALLPGLNNDTPYGSVDDALAAIGDANGNMSTVEKNTTWGNLVDLSDTGYGLNQIALYPAQLALLAKAEGATEDVLADYFLATPKYGSDGRFNGLATGALAAMYKGGSFGTNAFGVRAVGTSSGMSALELAYRDVLADANDAFNKAITQTKTATSNGGSALAGIAVSKATGTTVFDDADITNLKTAYSAVDTALGYIETALKQYIIAAFLASGEVNETTYDAALQVMQKADLATLANDYSNGNTTLQTYITNLTALQTQVKDTLTALNGLQPTGTATGTRDVLDEDGNPVMVDGVKQTETYTYNTYTWDQISAHVAALADVDKMLLNGNPIKYYMEDSYANINELVNNMSNLVLEVNADGNADTGIYARLADFVDTYTTPVVISGIEYSGISVNNLNATMKINATADPAYLVSAKKVAGTIAPTAFAGGGSSISDFYGYIIDMAFRTNAADSYLQLQTDAIDRVYADNESNPNTMGGGSTITYTVPAGSNYPVERLVKMMSFIRVVFFDPTTKAVLGYARLDATADNYDVTYVDTAETPDYNKGYTVTMELKMWNPNVNDGKGAWAESSTITNLVQNQATAVSTLVYLDGETLSNADVANVELTGTMNIQFSSSAELIPMEYGDLRNETEKETNPTTPAVDYTITPKVQLADTTTVSDAQISTVAVINGYAGFTMKSTAYTIASVTVDGTAVQVQTTSDGYGWQVPDTMTETSEIVITLTPVTQNP